MRRPDDWPLYVAVAASSHDDAVAALMLRFIQRCVRGGDERCRALEGLGVGGVHYAHADGGPDRELVPVRALIFDRHAHAFGHHESTARAHAAQDHRELLPAVASEHILLAD